MSKFYPADAAQYVDTEVTAIQAALTAIQGTGFATGTDALKILSDILDLIRTELTFQQQADATISQTNPVSTTLYPVLAATANVRLISIETDITWATTQPTPLEIVVTIDGVSTIFLVANPVSATPYFASLDANATAATQDLETTDRTATGRSFLLEGRSIQVQARITWATTQPTPLNVRVKYAKR